MSNPRRGGRAWVLACALALVAMAPIEAHAAKFAKVSYATKRFTVGGGAGNLSSTKVACGKRGHVLGGGVDGLGPHPQTSGLLSSAPVDGGDRGRAPDDKWAVTVRSFTGESYKALAFVSCAKTKVKYRSDGTADFEDTIPPGTRNDGSAFCPPSGGWVPTGGGVVVRPTSSTHLAAINSTGPVRVLGGDSGRADAWAALVENYSNSVPLPVRFWVACAKGDIRFDSKQFSVSGNGFFYETRRVGCKQGRTFTAPGAEAFEAPYGQSGIGEFFGFDDGDPRRVRDDGGLVTVFGIDSPAPPALTFDASASATCARKLPAK